MIQLVGYFDIIIMFSILIPLLFIGLRTLISKEKKIKITKNDRIFALLSVVLFVVLNIINFFLKA